MQGAPSKKPSLLRARVFCNEEPDDDLLSQMSIHYHRRKGVSLSCSGWEGVVPPCYGRQAKGLAVLGLSPVPPDREEACSTSRCASGSGVGCMVLVAF